jgi:hypothetical protein
LPGSRLVLRVSPNRRRRGTLQLDGVEPQLLYRASAANAAKG